MAKEPAKEKAAEENGKAAEEKPTCGLIMPISSMPPEYDAGHWLDVRRVVEVAIGAADMQPQMVSDSFESDVIQRRIVKNLYENPVVVCDVSGLNPNVMFELGMRITFKRPVVIVTDDVNSVPFDTSIIEHIPYPRDLHIHQTNDFIDKLSDRIKRLHEQVKNNSFKSFIEAFGTFETLQPTTEGVPTDTYLADRMDEILRHVRRIDRDSSQKKANHFSTMNALRSGTNSPLGALHSYAPRSYIFNVPADDVPADLDENLMAARGVSGVARTRNGDKERFIISFHTPSDKEAGTAVMRIFSQIPNSQLVDIVA